MKKYFKYVVVVLTLVLPLMSFAADFRSGEQASVGKNEKVANDVYIAGGSVTSAGNITGDLMAVGGNIVISGDVGQDVNAGGGNVNLLSNVGDDVRVGGGTVVIVGKIGGDLMVGGGQVNISGLGIGGDVVIGGGNVRIDAPVSGKLLVAGGNVYINAPITGDVKIKAEKITLGSNAVISGNLNYEATQELIIEDGGVVKGVVDFKLTTKKDIDNKTSQSLFAAFFVWKFFALLACALVVGLVFNRYCKEIVALTAERPIFEIGRGILVLIALPMLSVILFITLVGIPFGVIGLFGFIILMLFSWIVTPVVVGSVVYQYFSKNEFEVSWKTILLGVFVYTLLGAIPFIGWFIRTFLMFLVLGSIVALKISIMKEWR